LGANDGILSTASLVLGVAAAHGTHSSVLARLSQLDEIFRLGARKFLLLSTPAARKSAKTGQVKTLPLF
jgi:VIT1/CCC1 family predicted Fe2+/Mn2+ transporter